MGEFSNNAAHSNLYYGLRIFPEYYPRNVSLRHSLSRHGNGVVNDTCTR
jgi:hypothetical protein